VCCWRRCWRQRARRGWACGSWTARRRRPRCRPRNRSQRAAAAAGGCRTGAQPGAAPPQQAPPASVEGHWLADAHRLPGQPPDERPPGFFVVTPLRWTTAAWCWCSAAGCRATCRPHAHRAPPPPAGRCGAGPHRPPPGGCTSSARRRRGPIRQNLDIAPMRVKPVLPLRRWRGAGRRRHAAADGLLRQWPEPAADVHKHYGYAFQWFALSAWPACMSGSNSSAPDAAPPPEPLGLTVHELAGARPGRPGDAAPPHARPHQDAAGAAVCAAPVIASYFTYFVIRPEGRSNYGS
jgi:hypothetical protein